MFPVTSRAEQIVNEWVAELSAVTGHSKEQLIANPQCFDFPNQVLRIVLMDESLVEFRWAFHIVSEGRKSIAVFTEHCGHHVFPYHEAKVYRDGALVYEQKHA